MGNQALVPTAAVCATAVLRASQNHKVMTGLARVIPYNAARFSKRFNNFYLLETLVIRRRGLNCILRLLTSLPRD
jgi:hypothetical protein